VILESNGTECILHLDGDCTLTSAAELKSALIQALAERASGQAAQPVNTVCLDFGRAGEVDIAALQLLWAAEQAARAGERRLVSRVPEGIRGLARDAGFDSFPGCS
jgi:ABC-type transporter Mla MlaB component